MTSFSQALLAGACAGTAVDVLFFPLDSIKTRLQAEAGFWKSGGFSGVYRGLGSVVVGSAPGAAAFFTAYEQLKHGLPQLSEGLDPEQPLVHMLAASGGETTACLIRVPTEVVKQRQQTSAYGVGTSSFQAARRVLADSGLRGLYQGFGTTVAREIPFCCIQFPLYERLKAIVKEQRHPLSPAPLPAAEAAVCGSVAGAISAALTTPLDVAKTRIMLSNSGSSSSSGSSSQQRYSGTLATLGKIASQEGFAALFRGVAPRTLWIGLGGAVFLGVYERASQFLKGIDDSTASTSTPQ